MKKILSLLVAFVAAFSLCACDDGWHDYDDHHPTYPDTFNRDNLSNELSHTERNLLGSYKSDDGKEPVIYLTLGEDRSGSYASNGQTVTFSWYVEGSRLYMLHSDNQGEYYELTYDSSNRLCLNGIPFVANGGNGGDQSSDDVIVGQWQGKLSDEFYKDVYQFASADDLATILEFAADGTGAQLDYNEATPTVNFSANTFTWVRNGNTISLSYHDNANGWTSANIDGPSITSAKFTGSISYTNYAVYKLSFVHVTGFDWTPYLGYTSSQTRSADGKQQPRMLRLRSQATGSACGGLFRK